MAFPPEDQTPDNQATPLNSSRNVPPKKTTSGTNADYVPPWEARANDVKATKEYAARKAAKREANHKKFVRRKWRNRFILLGLIYFVYWFYTPHGIFVLGDPLSVSRYRGVLKDLKKEMPDEYEMVKNHIDKIKISYFIPGGNYAGYAQESEVGTKEVMLLENTFVQGPGYAHSTLVHEACHGLQFEKGLKFTPFCEKQSREHACNQMGLKVLYQFNADQEMINHYESIAGGATVYGNSCMRNGTLEAMPDL